MSRIDELIQKLCPSGVEYEAIAELITRSEKVRWDDLDQTDEFRYIDLGTVDRVKHSINDTETITKENAPSRAQQVVREGDVLFGTTRPMLKRYCIVPADYDGQVASTGFCVLRANTDRVLTNFLFHLLGTATFYKYVEANERGASYPAIPDNVVKKFRIPVPPLEVQREIVRVLDKFTQLEAELEAELEARRAQYEYYRDSQLAFSNNVERVSLGDLGELFGGLTGKSKADFTDGNVRFIAYTNVFHNIAVRTDLDDFVKVAPGERQRALAYGDVLFTGSSESADEVGMTSVVTSKPNEAVYLNSFSIGFRPYDVERLDPEFAKHLFRSHTMRSQIVKTANGVTRFNISKTRLRRIQVPIPSRAEQTRIARLLDKFEGLTNDLTIGLPAELAARRKQYEHYRDRLLMFKELAA